MELQLRHIMLYLGTTVNVMPSGLLSQGKEVQKRMEKEVVWTSLRRFISYPFRNINPGSSRS